MRTSAGAFATEGLMAGAFGFISKVVSATTHEWAYHDAKQVDQPTFPMPPTK